MENSRVQSLAEMERAAIIAALKEARGSKDGAAYLLGIGRSTLYRKLKRYKIELRDYVWRLTVGAGS